MHSVIINLGIMNIETISIISISVITGVVLSYIFLKNKRQQFSDKSQNKINELNTEPVKKITEKKQSETLVQNKKLTKDENSNSENKFLDENKKLKEDIELLEEDIEDFESKIKKKKKENEELLEKIFLIEKTEKELTEEKIKLEKITTEQKSEIIEKDKSLNCINDILNASNSNDKVYEDSKQKTDLIVYYIKNEIKYCLEDDSQAVSDEECDYWQNLELKSWIKNKKVIAIVGEFSAGKTSIVNRILSQDDPKAVLLPVNSKETTAIPTYISKGIDFNCQFYSQKGELKKIKKETFENLTKSVLDKIKISSIIKYLVISCDNKYLNNISILDTPGFGSNSNDIINRTTNVVKEADALFWVIDANAGEINQSSLNVIKNQLKDIPLYLIINKSDTKSETDLNMLQNKIKKTLDNNALKVNEILIFSNKKPIDELINLINKVKERKHSEIITEINKKLEALIKTKEIELKEAKNKRKFQMGNKDIVANNLKIIEVEITYCAESIDNMVTYESPFFSSDYYKIAQNKFDYFNENISTIRTHSSEITKQSKDHSEIITEQISIDSDISYINYQLKILKTAKETFIKLVKDYKPNLLN